MTSPSRGFKEARPDFGPFGTECDNLTNNLSPINYYQQNDNSSSVKFYCPSINHYQ
jgi:hypothetical protein